MKSGGSGETTAIAPGDGHTLYLPLPEDLDPRYALLMRHL